MKRKEFLYGIILRANNLKAKEKQAGFDTKDTDQLIQTATVQRADLEYVDIDNELKTFFHTNDEDVSYSDDFNYDNVAMTDFYLANHK